MSHPDEDIVMTCPACGTGLTLADVEQTGGPVGAVARIIALCELVAGNDDPHKYTVNVGAVLDALEGKP